MTNKTSASEPQSPDLLILDNFFHHLQHRKKPKSRNNSISKNNGNNIQSFSNINYSIIKNNIISNQTSNKETNKNKNYSNQFSSQKKLINFSYFDLDAINKFNYYNNKNLEINNTENQEQSIAVKELNELKLSKLTKNSVNNYDNNHQIALHPSLQQNKQKRCFSGDIVKYKSLIQELDDQYRQQQQQDQMPTIMIAQSISQPNLNATNGRRGSQIITFPRKKQKENVLAQKFIVMRQQRKKKKQAKKLRRKSCTCHECGGPATAYQIKHNDMDIQTAMARKVNLANIVIQNLKSQIGDNKNFKLRKEKQMTILKEALEKTLFEQQDNSQGQNELKQQDSLQQFQQEQNKYEKLERGNSKGRTNIRMTYISDYTPDKNTPGSKMTDQDYKERLTQTDLDNYKFNRNKSNYSRPQENIKKMRNTMLQYNIIESLSNIHDHDDTIQQTNRKEMFKNSTLSMSFKNLVIPEIQQIYFKFPINLRSPVKIEKKQNPYKLQQRNSQNSILKQLPPKIILRKDLQNLFFKQSLPFEKIIDRIEQTAHAQEELSKTSRFNLNQPQISNRNIPYSSIDLSSTTQQFFKSVIMQRQVKVSSHSQSDLTLKSTITSSSTKYNPSIPSPIKLKNTPVKSNDKMFFHNYNGQEQHNLFFNRDQNNKNQLLNPYTKNRITPLRSRSPHLLPQLQFMSQSTQK